MYRGKEPGTQTPERIGDLEPRPVLRDRNDDVHRLDGEHALEHPHVAKDRNPPYLARERRVGVVVEPEHPLAEPTPKEHVQGHPSVPSSPDYGYPYLVVEVDTLHLDFRFRCRSGCFGLSYLALLPVRNLARYSRQFNTLSG